MTAAGRRRQQGSAASGAEGRDGDGQADGRKRKRRGRPPAGDSKREGVRIVANASRDRDPREVERERLLNRLLSVEGRPGISGAAQAYLDAGFELPHNQGVWLQLLEHADEQTVVTAIERLTELIEEEAPTRRAVLDSRLRRIEEYADDGVTRSAAGGLRRLIKSRWASPTS
jgi:hypothetical protein